MGTSRRRIAFWLAGIVCVLACVLLIGQPRTRAKPLSIGAYLNTGSYSDLNCVIEYLGHFYSMNTSDKWKYIGQMSHHKHYSYRLYLIIQARKLHICDDPMKAILEEMIAKESPGKGRTQMQSEFDGYIADCGKK